MRTVGAFEAKTHLSKLLDQVAKGERITIEKHGIPVAVLQPAEPQKQMSAAEAIEAIKRFRAGRRLDGVTIRELIEEGRR
jgi:prevent-host-death family protein